MSWDNNESLDIKHLRLKCITLMSLFLMLRPSDIAPRSVQFNPETLQTTNIEFTRNQIVFNDDGSCNVTFQGIKNDTDRSGFVVKLPSHEVKKLDPASCLKCYMQFTSKLGFNDNLDPVFISLNKPYKSISAQQISAILNESIDLAGLGGMGYSAKYFRPTGATMAVSGGEDPEIIRKLGRWKTASVFYDHYVHSLTPTSVMTAILPKVEADNAE